MKETLALVNNLLRFARFNGLSESEVDEMYFYGMYHDVGKLMVPPNILNKPAVLSKEEKDIMKLHTKHGITMRSKNLNVKYLDEIILFHHEAYDGSGYYGIPNSRLSLQTRILQLLDIYTALTHERCYKKAWSVHDAMCYIKSNSGILFSPDIVQRFIVFQEQILDKGGEVDEGFSQSNFLDDAFGTGSTSICV